MNGSPDGWDCHVSCPIRLMNEQSGQKAASFRRARTGNHTSGWGLDDNGEPLGYTDSGGASRYFPNFSQEDDLELSGQSGNSQILVGDCREKMAEMPENSVDAIVTDPPAGISFMGKSWDSNRGSRNAWIAWLTEVMEEAYRVMKPGAHGLVWALPRTSHWTAMALEDAGFEIRDRVTHHFGSGFPKSHDVSKAIDRMAGAEREVVGHADPHSPRTAMARATTYSGFNQDGPGNGTPITAPSTEEAKKWQGFGTALKPSTEDWWLIRKPLSEKNVASNVLKHGTGAINIGATRVQHASEADRASATPQGRATGKSGALAGGTQNDNARSEFDRPDTSKGRWPSNTLLSHSPECRPTGEMRRVKVAYSQPTKGDKSGGIYNPGNAQLGQPAGYADPDGFEEVERWECVESCPVRLMDEQSGNRPSNGEYTNSLDKPDKGKQLFGSRLDVNDRAKKNAYAGEQGGASRFFPRFPSSLEPPTPFKYCAKASRKDRTANGTVSNDHPTCKPTPLLRWLIRLVTPPGGVLLDCFAGSGSTGVAAILEGVDCILIEQDESYAATAKARCEWAKEQVGQSSGRLEKSEPRPNTLF